MAVNPYAPFCAKFRRNLKQQFYPLESRLLKKRLRAAKELASYCLGEI
jgi:hypothetical protein